MLKIIIRCLFVILCAAVFASARADAGVSRQIAAAFMDDFYTALKNHDMPKLQAMMDDKASVVIYLADEMPSPRFTLSKADYLHQIKATWRFATKERYDIKDMSWQDDKAAGGVRALFSENESRMVLGSETGQRNQLEVLLVPAGAGLRIAAITAHSIMW